MGRWEAGALRGSWRKVASDVKAKLLSLLMKGGGQSGYVLKRIRVFSPAVGKTKRTIHAG